MRKQRIYLVMADTSYEGSTPICAFDSENVAKEFQAKCYAYHAKAPEAPNDPPRDTPENDKLYDDYFVKRQRWEKRHPAGKDNTHCDTFSVIPIPNGSNVEVK